MSSVLGRLLTVVAVLAGAASCERRHPAVIGVAFGEGTPGVVEVVQDELRRRYTDGSPTVRPPSQVPAEAGAPGAVTLATRLTRVPGLVAVVGHADSRGSLFAAPVYDEAHIPLLVPTSTSRRLRTVSPWVFMMSPDDSLEADFIAAFARESLHTRTFAIFYDSDEYGIGLRDGLRTAFAARGPRPQVEEPIALPCGSPETAEASILRAAASAIDLVIIAGRTRDAACLGRRLSERVPRIRIIGGDGVESDTTFDRRFGSARAPFYAVAVWHAGVTDSASVDFARAFRRIVGATPHASQALVFDAVMLLAEATHAVGTRPEAVRRYLAELGGRRPPYHGVTGAVAFGSTVRRPLYMLRIDKAGQ